MWTKIVTVYGTRKTFKLFLHERMQVSYAAKKKMGEMSAETHEINN